tara:strand:+ start:506 stop:1072 length:567 start_codon:yes stop_codon:yes gene_type:complete
MAIRKNKKRIDPRYFLNETTYRDLEEGGTFHDEIKRIEQQYGVSILLRDDEGRHGVSVMHRDEDQLPGEQYPNYSKQPVSYDNLEQAEEDLKSRQAQQKMSFKEEIEDPYLQKSPERADDQQSYEMAMGASRDTIMSVFGEEGELVWSLIETALHAKPGSFETVMPLHQEIEDLARIDSEVRSDMKEY